MRKPFDREAAKQQLDATLNTLKEGIAALTTSDEWKRFLEVSSAFHSYSFNNWMLIYMQAPHATRVAGYKTWLKLKRQVKKGEKSIRILAPMPRKFTAQVEKQNPSTGEVTVENEEHGSSRLGTSRLGSHQTASTGSGPRCLLAEPEPGREPRRGSPSTREGRSALQQRSYVRYRAVPVFDLSQTDGEDLPSLAHELQGSLDEDVMALDLFSRLESYAFQSGFAVEVKHISGEANGYMDPSSRVLAIEQDLPMLHRAKTLAHECAHMVLHADLDAKFEHNSRSQQEVEAESVAFCLMKAFGLDSSLCSFGYVAGWSNGDPDKVTEAGQNIQKAFHQLLDATAPASEEAFDEAA